MAFGWPVSCFPSISYLHFAHWTSLMTTTKRLFWCVHTQEISPASEALAVLEDKMVAWTGEGLISVVVSDLPWGHGMVAPNPDVKEYATFCIVAVSCCSIWVQPAPLKCVSSIVEQTSFWFENSNASKEPQLLLERHSVPFLAPLMFIPGVSELPATWAEPVWGRDVPGVSGVAGCKGRRGGEQKCLQGWRAVLSSPSPSLGRWVVVMYKQHANSVAAMR